LPTARLHFESALPPAQALARSQALLASVSPERPVLLYGAPFAGASVVLGAYQHAPHALRAEAFEPLALPVLRRRTGGATVWGGEGIVYFALGLLNASALMPCPDGRILNRNVRGFLSGARELGVPAYYFGRDFVSFGREPGAYVGWDEAGDGRVLLEFFVGLETIFTPARELLGYPARVEPALRGKSPVTLRSLRASSSAEELIRTLAHGYAKAFELDLESEAPSELELTQVAALYALLTVDLRDEGGLSWSSPREDAIGFVSAGVRLDSNGRFRDLWLGGDFFQHRDCPARLAAQLYNKEPTPEAIGAALDAVYGVRPGLIEGVRSLQVLREALLEAAARAAEHATTPGL
jgi:hypothetical protein